MQSKSIFITFILIFITSFFVYGQKNLVEEADEKFELNQFYSASQLYLKAYPKVDNKLEKNRILYQVGLCYYNMGDARKALSYFNRVIRAQYPDPEVFWYTGLVNMTLANYEEALNNFEKYKGLVPNDTLVDIKIESCKLSKAWMDNPTLYEVTSERKLNTRNQDFATAWADKRYRSIIFTSNRDGVVGKGIDEWTGLPFTDFFIAEKDKKGNWSSPVTADDQEILNTQHNEGVGCFNNKFNTFYFTRCRVEKKKILGCNIYYTTRRGRSWAEPILLPFTTDSTATVGHPAISDDEMMIIFSGNLSGGYGGRDLWMATRTKKNQDFGEPSNLGPIINTSGNEMFPTLRYVNNRTYLYFSSDGHPGMGGLDLYRSEYIDGQWTVPENLRYPLNSPQDDFHIIFLDDPTILRTEQAREMGFLSSNRNLSSMDDIYSFKLPPIYFSISGIVYDDSTKKPIPGAIVRIEGSDGNIYIDTTDNNGYYIFDKTQIFENNTYTIYVSKEEYLGERGIETTVGLDRSKDLVHDFYLIPIPKEPIVLPDILYDFDDWRLKPQYQDSLNGLVQILMDNPNIVIELGSHTDSRGTHEYNDSLSYKRAKAVVDYLISKGIEPDRLIPKGFGKRVPRVLEEDKTVIIDGKEYTFPKGTVLTEEYINSLPSKDQREAAHQLNRRTTFQIIRDDYVPTGEQNKPVQIEIIKEKTQ
ncbi:MAG TPA: OmpA family protein [Bacteroidales bacterium]|nr:OmpA family protein [Bacteroidales bacterium]HQD58942.1 OmpA family protein [Bacteroidales bacterium]